MLKIGMARHKISYVDMLLSLLRKAAVSGGYKIRARNIVYLNVSTGREMICSGGLRKRIALRSGQGTLQIVQRIKWTHSPKY